MPEGRWLGSAPPWVLAFDLGQIRRPAFERNTLLRQEVMAPVDLIHFINRVVHDFLGVQQRDANLLLRGVCGATQVVRRPVRNAEVLLVSCVPRRSAPALNRASPDVSLSVEMGGPSGGRYDRRGYYRLTTIRRHRLP